MRAGVSPRLRSESSPHESRRRRADPQALSLERGFTVFPVTGIPELRAGSDLPEPIAARLDPDGSAARLRDELRAQTERDVGVLISDSFGRPWRQGTTDVAIGASGVEVLRELSGELDPVGYELKATVIAVADELAGAAQLVAGKLDRVPVVIVRGLAMRGEGKATDIPIPPERDLFG